MLIHNGLTEELLKKLLKYGKQTFEDLRQPLVTNFWHEMKQQAMTCVEVWTPIELLFELFELLYLRL